MNRLMVKPTPHNRPRPTIAFQSIPSGNRTNPNSRASKAAPTTPTGLPSTSPRATPSGTGASASASLKSPRARPALAKANSGRIA